MSHPYALVVYNRPEHTRQVIESLKDHRPEPFYVFSDGPKLPQDGPSVSAVREVVRSHVTWTKPLMIERGDNFGLARSVVAAADYVLRQHDTIVLLEDDCVVGPQFPHFVETCLDRYKDDTRILGVTGYTVPLPEELHKSYPWDAYLFPRPGSWGWATWVGKWLMYDHNFKQSLAEANWDGIDLTVGGKDVPGLIQRAIEGKLDVWTPGWLTAVARYGYYIYPTESHVHNIGFDGTGVHCGKTNRYDSPIAVNKPTRFPPDHGFLVNENINENFRKYY